MSDKQKEKTHFRVITETLSKHTSSREPNAYHARKTQYTTAALKENVLALE